MENQEVSTVKEIHSAPQPVVFTSQSTGRMALAALSLMATSVAVSTPNAAMATQSAVQPVVFMSQPTTFKINTGEKLDNYELRLAQSLGKDGVNLRRNDGCTCSGGCADDCG